MGFPNRHHDPEIEGNTASFADRAGYVFQPVGKIGLGSQVEVHISMNREGIATLQTKALPLAIRLQTQAINHKGIGLADRASDAA